VPRLALLGLALALLACSTQRAYDPDALAQRNTALIRPARHLARQVIIESVDGRPLGWFRDRVRVAPGPHEIRVTVVFSGGARDVRATHALRVDAHPGAEYAVSGEWAWYGPAAVLRDADTRERIASAEPRPPVGAGPP
jgi:hypothetical protein